MHVLVDPALSRVVPRVGGVVVTATGEDPNLNSDGIVEWGTRNIIPVVLLFIGIAMIASARKGQMSQNAMTITNVLLGCALIGGAALVYGFGDDIAAFVFAD